LVHDRQVSGFIADEKRKPCRFEGARKRQRVAGHHEADSHQVGVAARLAIRELLAETSFSAWELALDCLSSDDHGNPFDQD
jgi:hypothetical protein